MAGLALRPSEGRAAAHLREFIGKQVITAAEGHEYLHALGFESHGSISRIKKGAGVRTYLVRGRSVWAVEQ